MTARSELQYNLQKARALATELRTVLEAIDEADDFAAQEAMIDNSGHSGEFDWAAEVVGEIESALDKFPDDIIGPGSVGLMIAAPASE